MKIPSERCKEIYNRHINEGVTLTQIAEELGISVARVSQLYRQQKRYLDYILEKAKWSEDNIIQLDIPRRLEFVIRTEISSSIYNLVNDEAIDKLLKIRNVGIYQTTDVINKAKAYIEEHSDYYESVDVEINNSTYNVKNFISWLKQFEDFDSSYGDLIRDIKRDPNFPTNLSPYTFDDLRTYIKCQGSCQECINTLEDAYKVFSKG